MIIHGENCNRIRLIAILDVVIGAKNRFDTLALRCLVEFHQAVEIAEIRCRYGGNISALAGLDQIVNAHQRVLQGELGVDAQMDEGHGQVSVMIGILPGRQSYHRQGLLEPVRVRWVMLVSQVVQMVAQGLAHRPE